ncbi:transportin [Thraustotheca clavata]|uniref:Transportin n=1 Tax=Thraustotheca clavata TaxID=74557 RepID=A0A1V9Z3M0_9STRA|nr:transportin [Thraustotheca clavata]
MSNWQPAQEALGEVVALLQASTVPDNEVQQQFYQRLTQYSANPEFHLYLLHVFAHYPDIAIRQVAGLLLKKSIKAMYHTLSIDMQTYMRMAILSLLADPNTRIRSTAGVLLTTVVAQLVTLEQCPEMIPGLIRYLEDAANENGVEGAFSALSKICEDHAEKLDSPSLPTRPLNSLVPLFLKYFHHPKSEFRRDALNCINQLILIMPAALEINMDAFLQGISHLTQDSSSAVRKLVCQSIVILLEVRMQVLMPHLSSIVQFILRATSDNDENVALEACEFWSSICDLPNHLFKEVKPVLNQVLPHLIPLLLSRMVYSEETISMFELEEQEQNESVPDRPEDIKPIFHKAKPQENRGNASDEDDDEGDFENDDDEDVEQWTLRKSAAAGLDTISHAFGVDILPILLPLLQERLGHSGHWAVRESGILALGAIAEGCMDGILPHLPSLFPYLLQLMDDPAPYIRSITCWTLGRYANWAVSMNDHEHILRPLIETMLKRISDPNKKVQQAACSAFCTLEEEALDELVPYLAPILHNLMYAFGKYQARNLLILYDAIGTLADSVGSYLNNAELIAVFMPPLIVKWNALPDDNAELFPLLECLTSIATALGAGFQEFARPVLDRCIRLIEHGLLSAALAQQSPSEIEATDPEFIVCALDLISGISEGLTTSMGTLIQGTNVLNLVVECVRFHDPNVRQSALAVMGDFAKYCSDLAKPHIKDIVPLLLGNINPEYPSVCNNASWAFGEVAIKAGADIEPFAMDAMDKLLFVLNNVDPKRNRGLHENCAITIGRLGVVVPQTIAPSLGSFAKQWCSALRFVGDATDREHCFTGLCYLVQLNPQGIVQDFMTMCIALASLEKGEDGYDISPKLHEMLLQIVQGFKMSLGDNWARYYASFPAPLQEVISARYQV